MKKIFLSIIILFAASCKDNVTQQAPEQKIILKDSQITIPENSPVLKKIKTVIINDQEYSHDITSVGTIETILTIMPKLPARFREESQKLL